MLQRHIAALQSIKGHKVEAGWFETDRYPIKGKESVGVSVAYVARVQEFGAVITRGNTTITIPARPFMRLAWSNFNRQRGSIQAKIAVQIVNGELTSDKALGQIGLAMEAAIKRSIRNGGWAPNAPSTAKRKGFKKNTPLIDTGLMWKSVSSKVS